MFGKRTRHLSRYREIATLFARHGFGFIIEEIGLLHMLSLPKRLLAGNSEIDPKSFAERIRRVIEELGPTFVKIGQIASTRPDIIPEDIIQELENLQDNVAPFPSQEVHAALAAELGAPVEEIFQSFDSIPIAAASIGQVHKAVLKDGTTVAVKVQRPQITGQVETDLDILQDLARMAEQRLAWAQHYRLSDIVEEFARSLHAELDYQIEGRNAERVAQQFEQDATIHIPKIYWEYSTRTVLTMEYVQGIKLNHTGELISAGYDTHQITHHIVEAIFKQIMLEGFFHGDPHPGNIMVLPGQVISFLDFGMVGRLTPDMKYHFASLVIGMINKSTDLIVKTVLQMGIAPHDIDKRLLYRDVDDLKEKYLNVPLSEISLGAAVNELFTLAFKYRIRIPADLTLLGKSLLTLEGIVEKLDPQISIMDLAQPFGRKLLKERYSPRAFFNKLWQNLKDSAEFIIEFPRQLRDIVDSIGNKPVQLEVKIPELTTFSKRLDRISNQLSFSIILLSFSILMMGLIIAASISGQTALLWKVPVVEFGFAVATLMFLWLLIAIFRSGRF